MHYLIVYEVEYSTGERELFTVRKNNKVSACLFYFKQRIQENTVFIEATLRDENENIIKVVDDELIEFHNKVYW